MKAYSTLWAGLPTRIKLRFATAGIASVAEEVVGLPSAERVALFAAADAADAPEALMRRTALVRAYINQYLGGGIPEDRALEAELEALIGLDPPTDTSNVSVTQAVPSRSEAEVEPTTVGDDNSQEGRGEPAVEAVVAPRPVPTSPIPGPVTPIAVEKPATDRAREAHEARENALAEANANTPARKPERIVPRLAPMTPVDKVSEEARERLTNAPRVSTVAELDALTRVNRDFVTGKRFKDGDDIVMVNRRALTTRDRAKACYRAENWTFVPVKPAREALADWDIFLQTISGNEISLEMCEKMLQERIDHEYGVINDATSHSIDKCVAHFVIWLAKDCLNSFKRATEEGVAQKNEANDAAMRASRAVEAANARAVWVSELREQYTTRALIKARQEKIKARHMEIAAALEDFSTRPCMDADEKRAQVAALKRERWEVGQEFEIISGFWDDLPDDREEGQPTFRAVDSARPTYGISAFVFGSGGREGPIPRVTGKTARQRAARYNGGAMGDNKPVELTLEERDRRRQEAEQATAAAKAVRHARAEAARQRRNDPHFGESRNVGGQSKKGKSVEGGGDSKRDRRAAKKAVKHARG